MDLIKSLSKKIVLNNYFENIVVSIIMFNSIIIGLETYSPNNKIYAILNMACLIFYIFEIIVRYFASKDLKSYLYDGWNIFNILVVLVCFIPENIFENATALAALRIARIFRVMLLFKNNREMRLITSVMIKSMKSLTYNFMVILIFMYIFALSGTYMFKLPNAETATPEVKAKLEQLHEIAPHAPGNADDPYGTLGEATFTLLRTTTGDDWTDLRYNLITASRMGLINLPPFVVSLFHIVWYILSAFLLLNLIVASVVSNYQYIMDKETKEEQEKNK